MDITLVLTLTAVFACVALMSGSATYLVMQSSSPAHRRIRQVLGGSGRQVAIAGDQSLGGVQSAAVTKVTTFIPKSPKDMSRLQRRFAFAGLHGSGYLVGYLIAEVLLPAIAFVLAVVFLGWAKGMMFGLMGAIVGYLAPRLVLDLAVKRRQKEIENGLPDALDLLIVSIEAGLAIDQAVLRCAEQLHIAYPALAQELRYVNVECRAGKPRVEAFKNFAARTKVDDVRALVAMLVQTDRFGTSIAQALRTYAQVSRTKRKQRAEERAAKIGVKMVFPLVFCLFPALYVVTLGAAVIKFVHAFGSGGSISGGF